jgi:hypothetical protein
MKASTRNALPSKDFAGPGRSFPVEDAKHARLAKAGASRAEHAGNISKATESKIDAKADKKLGVKTHGHPSHVSYK